MIKENIMDKKELESKMNRMIYNIIALRKIEEGNLDSKTSYQLGVISGITESISTICFNYLASQNKNIHDKKDIQSFHSIYKEIGVYSYEGEDVIEMAKEIMDNHQKLVEREMEKINIHFYTTETEF